MIFSRGPFDRAFKTIQKTSRGILERFGILHPELPRFIAYSAFGITTFFMDLGLLWLFADVFQMKILHATALSFLIAITLNYLSNRLWVFRGSSRAIAKGYVYFLLIATTGLVLILGLMWVMTHILGMDFVIARIIAAGLVGIWNFGMNRVVNFIQ